MKGKSHLILEDGQQKKWQKNGQNKLGSFFILPLLTFTLAPHWRGVILPSSPIPTGRWNPQFVLGESVIPTSAAEISFPTKTNTAAPGNAQARWKAARSPAFISQFNSVNSMSIPELHPLRNLSCHILAIGYPTIPQSSNAREEFQGPKLPRLLWPRPIS